MDRADNAASEMYPGDELEREMRCCGVVLAYHHCQTSSQSEDGLVPLVVYLGSDF